MGVVDDEGAEASRRNSTAHGFGLDEMQPSVIGGVGADSGVDQGHKLPDFKPRGMIVVDCGERRLETPKDSVAGSCSR